MWVFPVADDSNRRQAVVCLRNTTETGLARFYGKAVTDSAGDSGWPCDRFTVRLFGVSQENENTLLGKALTQPDWLTAVFKGAVNGRDAALGVKQ